MDSQEQFLRKGDPNQPIAQSRVVPIGSGLWLVEQGFTAEVVDLAVKVLVPPGYVSNIASIPRVFWWLIGHPLTGEFQDPALAHDRMCELAQELNRYSIRVIGDAIFFHLLEDAGVPYWKRSLMYMGVRMHGFFTFSFRAWFGCKIPPQRPLTTITEEKEEL